MRRRLVSIPAYLDRKPEEKYEHYKDRHIRPVWDRYAEIAQKHGICELTSLKGYLEGELGHWRNYWLFSEDHPPNPSREKWDTQFARLEGIAEEAEKADTKEDREMWEAAYWSERNALNVQRRAFESKDNSQAVQFRLDIITNIIWLYSLGHFPLRWEEMTEDTKEAIGAKSRRELHHNSRTIERVRAIRRYLDTFKDPQREAINNTLSSKSTLYELAQENDATISPVKNPSDAWAKDFDGRSDTPGNLPGGEPKSISEWMDRLPNICAAFDIKPPRYQLQTTDTD